MKRGISRGLIAVMVGALVLAFAGIAGGKIKTKTFSSGTINEEFGDGETATHDFNLNQKKFKKSKKFKPAKVKDVNVAVRISSSCPDALDLELTGPTGRTVAFSTNNGDGGCNIPPDPPIDAYGSGSQSCDGTLTVFNDEAETGIADGAGPFNGQFVPEEPLSELDDTKVKGTWRVSVRDDDGFGDTSTLHCAELEIKYSKKKKRN
jgi:subtilisin-like proprotein convertase family protein